MIWEEFPCNRRLMLSGLSHVAWGGGPMTPMVIPMEAWISKGKAANQTASMDEGRDQT